MTKTNLDLAQQIAHAVGNKGKAVSVNNDKTRPSNIISLGTLPLHLQHLTLLLQTKDTERSEEALKSAGLLAVQTANRDFEILHALIDSGIQNAFNADGSIPGVRVYKDWSVAPLPPQDDCMDPNCPIHGGKGLGNDTVRVIVIT